MQSGQKCEATALSRWSFGAAHSPLPAFRGHALAPCPACTCCRMAGTAAAGAGPPWISRSPSRKNLDKRAAVSAAATMRSVARAPQWKTFEGRTFFLDNQHISEDARKRLGDRLKNLGALVTPFLDSDIDCVVATNTGTPSAPSTPTGGSTSTRGISLRAQLILNSNNSKTGAGTGTLQTTPAQFAESHGKHVLSARALEALLAAEEQRREHDSQLRAECSNKRSRAGPNSNDNAEDGDNPCHSAFHS